MAVVTGQAVVFKGNDGLGILLGSGPPDSTVGVDGQPGYLDTTNNLLYGPRVSGAWPAVGYQFGGNLLMYVGKPPDSFGAVGNLSLDIGQGFIYGPRTASGWPAQPLLALVGPQGIQGVKGDTGAAGVSPTLPTDYTANSLVVTPVSGATKPVQIALTNAGGTTLFKSDASGNVTVAGTLAVAGTSTVGNLTLASGGKVTYADGTSQATAAVSTPSYCVIDMGNLLPSGSNAYPTSYTQHINWMSFTNGTSGNAYARVFACDAPGSIISISGWIHGFTVNKYYFQVFKNGNATGLVATIQIANGGASAVWSTPRQNPGVYTFAAGDFIVMQSYADSGATARGVQAQMLIRYN